MKKLVMIFAAAALISTNAVAVNLEEKNDSAKAEKRELADSTVAQYFAFSFGGGLSTMLYKPIDGVWNTGFGGSFELAYHVMFKPSWGLGIGIQGVYFSSSAVYNFNYGIEGLMHRDAIFDNNKPYTEKYEFRNWKERQNLVNIELPIKLLYRHRFADAWSFAFNPGIILTVPVYGTLRSDGGEAEVSGYVPSTNVEYRNVGHHFETYKTGEYKDVIYKYFNFGVCADLGFIHHISLKSDLYLGLYAEYHILNSIKPTNDYIAQVKDIEDVRDGKYIFDYKGSFRSDRVSKVNPLYVGVKLGFRFRVDNAMEEKKKLDEKLAQGRRDKAALDSLKAKYVADSLADAERMKAMRELAAEDSLAAADRLHREQGAKSAVEGELARLRAEHDSLQRKQKEILERKRISDHINSIAHFDTAQDFPYIDEESEDALRRLAELMKENPNIWVTVFGHADNTGSYDMNIIYGQRRAEAMKKVLMKYGADGSRIIPVSRGDTDPVASNDNEEGRRLNRRAEIDIQER
ncbi:MAG: OmpA family protein [Paludibacteraceae bacterium]|nr:OmpA family protein [Paludibacteraceae bacterium]